MMEKLDDIQGELEAARQRLKGVEENIKKSIGRDVIGPANQRAGFKRTSRVVEDEETPRRVVTAKRRNVVIRRDFAAQPPGERVSAKKRLGEQTVTVFSRLSGPPRGEDDDDGEKTAKVPSQVIVTDTPSRRDVLEAQSGDQHSKARNRRMFGALLGTLQKFRQEEDALKEKVEKRAQVEKKLEEAALREREEIKKKRQELFSSRRQQQIEIRQLEFKLTRLKQLEEWEKNKKHLLNFIQTTAAPRIFYLPKKHNEKTEKLLETTQEEINKAIEEKRAKVEKTIADFFERRPTGGDREKKVTEKEDGGEEEEEEEVAEEVEEEEKEENGSVSDKENNASPLPIETVDTPENL